VRGEYGNGFQWGECFGWGKLPLEQTDADAQVTLAALAIQIEKAEAACATHETGKDSYTASFLLHVEDWCSRLEATKAALDNLGLEYKLKDVQVRVEGYRVSYQPRHQLTVTVPRGYEGVDVSEWGNHGASFKILSWEQLRALVVRDFQHDIKAMTAQRAAIMEAVEHHRANPSNGVPVVKKGPKVHYSYTRERKHLRTGAPVVQIIIPCTSKSRGKIRTTDKAEVTCSRCLNHLKKNPEL
jgi:hypothetical protein